MLPKMIDLRRSADQDIEYQTRMQASLLARLEEAVDELDEEISVRIRLHKDEQGRLRVTGEAAVQAKLTCQRCMQLSDHLLETEIDLVAVYSEEQAKALPKELDAWVVEDSANLHELIEDELLLAMPIVAYHPEEECSAAGSFQSGEPVETVEKRSPFAVLKDLASSSD